MSDRILHCETLYEGWLSLRMLTIRMDDGEPAKRPIVDHPTGAVVLPYDPDRRVALLIKELRVPVEYVGAPRLLEALGGKLDEGDPAECARREAEEEAGVKLGALEHVVKLWPSPASTTERIDMYLAPYSRGDCTGEGGGLEEEQEEVRVQELPLDELWRRFEDGALCDMKAIVLLQALRIRRPELFAPVP